MDCEGFRATYDRWWDQGPVDNSYPEEQAQWHGHQHSCRSCSDWAKRRYCLGRGIEPIHHCCLDMAYAISHPVVSLNQGPNRVLDWNASWDEYRIPMPYDGYSSTIIRHCPFCGARLPDSKGQRWRETLRALGYLDPGEDEIPPDFESDRWWRADENRHR